MAATFLTMLAGGMLGLTALCRADQIAWRFFPVVAIATTAMLCLVLGFLLQNAAGPTGVAIGGDTVAVAVAAMFAVGFVVVTSTEALYRPRLVRPLTTGGAIASLVAATMLGHDANIWPAGALALGGLAVGGMVLSAWVVGSVTLATMLGHAYLTATKMTIAPLRRLAGLFAAAVVVRSLWVFVVGGAVAWSMLSGSESSAGVLRREVLMISLRLGVGLLLPCMFAYMIWATVKLRATQSATGILYFTMVLAYIGELTGMYLIRATGVPF